MAHRNLVWTLPLLIAVPLLPLFGADEAEQRRKLDKLRAANPTQYARLRQETRAFLALPVARQEKLLKLDRELHDESSSAQKQLVEVMHRYADWLEGLTEGERLAVLQTADKTKRLQVIRSLREKQWLRAQPRAIQTKVAQLELAKAPTPVVLAARTVGQLGWPRALGPLAGASTALAGRLNHAREFVAQVKWDEKKRRQDWQITARHWEDVLGQKPLPNRPAHFGKDVEKYVNVYLRHLLSKEELEQLKAVEGHWPQYPYLLVELADRHPLALPGPRGIDSVAKLPLELKEGLARAIVLLRKDMKGVDKKEPKGVDKVIQNSQFFKKVNGHWPQFGTEVASFAAKRGVALPPELFPTHVSDLSPQMQRFVTERLVKSALSREEGSDLKGKEGLWPDYPLKIQALADKYHLQPPWLTLPGSRDDWDKYRLKRQASLDGFPELPLHTLRDYAQLELSPQERAALKLSPLDPASVQRLTQKYFQDKPGELKRLRQTDIQYLGKHGSGKLKR